MSTSPPSPQVLAEAAARRQNVEPATTSTLVMQEHEKRQMFRRLIDPGIFRPNSKEVAMDSLRTLSTMAENILRDPDNPKYHEFKHENETIKRRLIQPKGALEYALALGFRPKVMEFSSHYVFHANRMQDLRIGAAILKEALDRETGKEARVQRDREEKKAAEAAMAHNVKLAFLDDRKNKMMRDQRERELRDARQAQGPSVGGAPCPSAGMPSSVSPEPEQCLRSMPGQGYMLTGAVLEEDAGMAQLPPYND